MTISQTSQSNGTVTGRGSWGLPILVVIAFSIFCLTSLVGGISAYMTISGAQTIALSSADQMELSQLQLAKASVLNLFTSSVKNAVTLATEQDMISFVAQGPPFSWRDRPDILQKIYQHQKIFNFVPASGMYFHPTINGTQAFVFISPSTGQFQWQDQSVNNVFWQTTTGVDVNGMLWFDAAAGIPLIPNITAMPFFRNGYWTVPFSSPYLKTYLFAYGLSVWTDVLAPQVGPNNEPYAAVYVTWLTTKSLEDYLRTIPTTPNAVLALIDVPSGTVLAASVPGIAVDWPTRFPAVGNPNALLSAASQQILGALAPTVATNDSTAFASITDRSDRQLVFAYSGDTAYCSTTWITDDSANLALLLVLVTPAGDLLGPVRTTTRNTVVFVVVFTVFAFVVGALIAWVLTTHLRRTTANVKKATQFDFSIHEDDPTALKDSWLVELGDIGSALHAMMLALAAAVVESKSRGSGSYFLETNIHSSVEI
ncbi:hypothetical protein HK405_000174 [Cladochytrium tenue]|nr:hypothetical protein HK405_000174 [Cladochytrium tenue]